MQIAGSALRMDFGTFRTEFQQDPELHRLVLHQVQTEALVRAQLAACNRLHDAEKRLTRWLLMVSARTGGSLELELTQEFLAEMLGTRRSTMTVVAGSLQRSGLIEYRRGKIRIADRERMEQATCECFAVIQKLYRALYQR